MEIVKKRSKQSSRGESSRPSAVFPSIRYVYPLVCEAPKFLPVPHHDGHCCRRCRGGDGAHGPRGASPISSITSGLHPTGSCYDVLRARAPRARSAHGTAPDSDRRDVAPGGDAVDGSARMGRAAGGSRGGRGDPARPLEAATSIMIMVAATECQPRRPGY
jgi:hypothetical protein